MVPVVFACEDLSRITMVFDSIDLILFGFVEFDSTYKYCKYLLPDKITKEIFLFYWFEKN